LFARVSEPVIPAQYLIADSAVFARCSKTGY